MEERVYNQRTTTYLLAQTANMIRNVWIDPVLKKYGITSAQYTLLSFVKNNPGKSSADLARHFFVTPQTMGPILSQLEKKGLLVREENEENRRLLSVFVTKEGVDLLKPCDDHMKDVESKIYGFLSDDENEIFRSLLNKIYKKSRE